MNVTQYFELICFVDKNDIKRYICKYNIRALPKKEVKMKTTLLKSKIVLIALLLCLMLPSCIQKTENLDQVAVLGKNDEDGTVFIPLYNGKVIEIKGDIRRASVTPDREKIIVLENDDRLYQTDLKLKEKITIADDVLWYSDLQNEGLFYINSSHKTFRYTFADRLHVEIEANFSPDHANFFDFLVAKNSLSVLYVTEDGSLFTMPYNAISGNRIASTFGNVQFLGISDDGKICVWSAKDTDIGEYKIFLYDGDESHALFDKNPFSPTYIQFSKNDNLVVLINYGSDILYFKERDGKIISAKLGGLFGHGDIFTNTGPVYRDQSNKFEGLYLLAQDNRRTSLYHVDTDGDREKLISDVVDMEIVNGNLFYSNSEGDLFFARLKINTIENEKRIAYDVADFVVSSDGKIIYYTKNLDSLGTGTLYRKDLNGKEPEKISSNVSHQCYFTVDPKNCFSELYVSVDGNTIYYFEDVNRLGYSWGVGNLMSNTLGNESIKISSEVIMTSLTSGLFNKLLNPSYFTFEKFVEVTKDNHVLVNWMFFNGKNTGILVKNVSASFIY